MRRVEEIWGTELIWAQTDKYIAKTLTIIPGQKTPKQYHRRKDKTIYVTKGTLVLELGSAGDMVRMVCHSGYRKRISPGTIHRMSAPSTGCVVQEVSTPELEDVIIVEESHGKV
jgi:quercetin dioxygenase-like cupin family protein